MYLIYDLDIGLGRDRKPPSIPKSFGRNFESGRGLLPFVLAAFYHANHPTNQLEVEFMIGGNLLRAVRFFDVVLEYRIQHLVRRKRVAVFLAGT